MANLMDIYFKVGKDLFEHGFDQKDTVEKKRLVNGCLKTYLAGKVAEESPIKAIELSNNPKVSVSDLVIMLGELIPEEEHFDTMRHLTHFMLNIAGEMQGWSITWWEEKDPEYIDNQLLTFNEDGKIDSLTTHKQTSYVHTFQFVHEVFESAFMLGKTGNKQLTKTNIRQIESNE